MLDDLHRAAGSCPHCGNNGAGGKPIGVNPNRPEPTWARCWDCMTLWNWDSGEVIVGGEPLPRGLTPQWYDPP